MSIEIYDFLDNSILLDDIAAISDDRLQKELESYRSHVLRSLDQIREGITPRPNGPRAFVATASRTTVDRSTLRHMVLYFDRAVVDDPLLSIYLPSPEHGALSEFIGTVANRSLNRQALVEALDFVVAVRPMVKAGFLTIAPIGAANEPSPTLPLLFSPTLFEERVPAPLREWFRGRARVFRFEQTEHGWVSGGEALTPTRSIGIVFSGLRQSMMFRLAPMNVTNVDEDSRTFTLMLENTDAAPPAEEFDVWVRQSINQFAGTIYADVVRDVVNATSIGAMLLTDSTLVGDLLSEDNDSAGIDHQVAELALQLNLPVLDGLSEADLMRIRERNPASLEAFRIQLDRGLASVAAERDDVARQRKLAEFRHEMTLKARETSQAVQRLHTSMKTNIALGVASLAAQYFAGGIVGAGALVAASAIFKQWNELKSGLQTTPGHFLLKLEQAKKSDET